MPGLFERVLIEGVLLIIVVVCCLLAVMAIRKGRTGSAPPEVRLPTDEEQLAHFDELLQQREAELRQRQQRQRPGE